MQVEIGPGTTVSIPCSQRELIFNMANDKKDLARRLTRAFYMEKDVTRAGFLNKLKDSDQIIPAIIACTLKCKREWPKTDEKPIKKMLHNMIGYVKRGSQRGVSLISLIHNYDYILLFISSTITIYCIKFFSCL